MPIFRGENSRTLIGLVLIIVFGGYQLISSLPASHHVFNLAQTSVAILALVALVFLVAQHHMREGQMLTQTQEEMILIGGFGLFWLAMLIAYQTYRNGGFGSTGAAQSPVVDVRGAGQRSGTAGGGSGGAGGQRPCSPDAAYCVVEEWSYSYW